MKVSQELFETSNPDEIRFLVRERKARFNWFRRVLVHADRARIIDINRNELVFVGIGFESPLLEMLLKEAGASYDPMTMHLVPETRDGSREHPCGACYPWAHDRIS